MASRGKELQGRRHFGAFSLAIGIAAILILGLLFMLFNFKWTPNSFMRSDVDRPGLNRAANNIPSQVRQLKFDTVYVTPQDEVFGTYKGEIYSYDPFAANYKKVASPTKSLEIDQYTAYGHWLIWSDGGPFPGGANWQLNATDLNTGKNTILAQDNPTHEAPLVLFSPHDFSIYADRVVWVEYEKHSHANFSICYSENLNTSQRVKLFQIKSPTTLDGVGDLSLYQNNLAWVDYSVDWAKYVDVGKIYLYDLGIGSNQLIAGPGMFYSPMIWGNRIVWYEKGLNNEDVTSSEHVVLYNIKTKRTRALTDNLLPSNGYMVNDSISSAGVGLSVFDSNRGYYYLFDTQQVVPIDAVSGKDRESGISVHGTVIGRRVVAWIEQWNSTGPNNSQTTNITSWISILN